MTWRARSRFRILGLLHVLAGMSPTPQPISLFLLSPAPAYYEGLYAWVCTCQPEVHAVSQPPGLPWGCRVRVLLMQTALGRSALGKKLTQPWEGIPGPQGAGSGRPSVDCGCGHPLSLADSSPLRRAQQRRTRWGLGSHSTFN